MRYLPLTDRDRRDMLAAIGVDSIDALFADVPGAARLEGLVDLPKAKGELEVERAITEMAARNIAADSVPFFIGGGVYRHHIPAAPIRATTVKRAYGSGPRGPRVLRPGGRRSHHPP